LTGRPPFDGATPTDVVLARLNNPAPSLREFRDDVHPETVALVARMLESDPSMRYPSYPALLLDMRAAYKVSCIPPKSKSGKSGVLKTMSTVLQVPSRHTAHKALKIGGLVALVLAILIGGVVMHQRKQARLAAEQAARERMEAAVKQGEAAWGRIGALIQHIVSGADQMAELETKIWEQASKIGDKHPSATLAVMESDRYQESYNEAEDLFAIGFIVQQDLPSIDTIKMGAPGDNDPDQIEACAAKLENVADKLVQIYQMIDIPIEAANKQFKEMGKYYARLQAAEKQARKRAAEAAARRRAELAAKKQAEKEAREAEKRRPIVLQQEYDTVEAARGENAALVAKRQFKNAMQAMEKVQPTLTLPETQAYCSSVVDTYRYLDKMMARLVELIKKIPYSQGWATSGGARDIVSADAEGLTVALGQVGAINIKWEQVTVQQMMNIAAFYLKNPSLSAADREDLMLAAALLCYESGAFKPVEALIAEIIKINPNRQDELNRLMPGLAE
jgi:hypothetical protein